jgi:hypothetical protein
MDDRRYDHVGGTPGGLGHFLLGFVMACIGGYLITSHVTLIPMLAGIGILFWNGRNPFGWLLTIGGALFILAGVIANMHIYFQPTTLFQTVVMLVLLVGGLALIARALRPYHERATRD